MHHTLVSMSSYGPRTRMIDWAEEYLDVGLQSDVTNTRKGPRSVVMPFAMWYDETRRAPRNVTREDLIRFFLQEAPFVGKICGRTHNSYRRYLRAFLMWCMETDRLKTQMSLLEAIKKRGIEKRDFIRLDGEQLVRVIESCTSLRDRALLAANFHALARSSEIRALRLGDIDLDGGVIYWTNVKKRRPVEKRITPQLDRELRAWIAAYTGGGVQFTTEPTEPIREWFAFPQRRMNGGRGERYYPMQAIVETAKLVQKYTEPITGRRVYDGGTHMGRRSGAKAMETSLVEQGYDPASARAVAQHMCDHEHPETTDRYTGNSLPQMLAHKALTQDFLPDLDRLTQLRSVDDGSQEAV